MFPCYMRHVTSHVKVGRASLNVRLRNKMCDSVFRLRVRGREGASRALAFLIPASRPIYVTAPECSCVRFVAIGTVTLSSS